MRVFTVDAFADAPFSGNPAAVVLVEEDAHCASSLLSDDETMLRIAQEMNLSETAFVAPIDPGASFKIATRFQLKWFTPKVEVNLCGHATLATAKTIFGPVGNISKVLEFQTLSGILVARRDGDVISMDLPANPPDPGDAPLDALNLRPLVAAAVGDSNVAKIISTFYSPCTKKLGVVLDISRAALEEMPTSPASLLAAHDGTAVRGVIITIASSKGSRYDFLSRYFAPWVGIDEDPVTGSAHTVLVPWWSKRLGKTRLAARQCSSRGGDLDLRYSADNAVVAVAGTAVVVLDGRIRIG